MNSALLIQHSPPLRSYFLWPWVLSMHARHSALCKRQASSAGGQSSGGVTVGRTIPQNKIQNGENPSYVYLDRHAGHTEKTILQMRLQDEQTQLESRDIIHD